MNTTPEPENTITQGEGMKSRTEALELLAKEMEVLDMTEGAIASDEVWGGEKVAQLNAEDRAKNAKDSGHTLLTYLSHFNHLPYTDIAALGKLKTSLLNIEGGLMTKAAMLREEQNSKLDNIYDFRCDVVAQARLRVQFYLDHDKKN